MRRIILFDAQQDRPTSPALLEDDWPHNLWPLAFQIPESSALCGSKIRSPPEPITLLSKKYIAFRPTLAPTPAFPFDVGQEPRKTPTRLPPRSAFDRPSDGEVLAVQCLDTAGPRHAELRVEEGLRDFVSQEDSCLTLPGVWR